MNDTFWSAMAQVSATLASLVFVGNSIYLSNIYQSTTDIGARLSEARQVQRAVVQIAVFANLLHYWIPLIVALTLLLGARLDALPAWLVALAGLHALAPLVYLEILYRKGQSGNDWSTVCRAYRKVSCPDNAHPHVRCARDLLRSISRRLRVGRWLITLCLLAFMPIIFWWRDTPVATIFCIANLSLGAIFSVLDLMLFRAENVLYHNVEHLSTYFKGDSLQIRALMAAANATLNASATEQEARPFAPRIQELRRLLGEQIPDTERELPMVEDFERLGPVVTAAQIRGYSWSLQRLRAGVDELHRLLTIGRAAGAAASAQGATE